MPAASGNRVVQGHEKTLWMVRPASVSGAGGRKQVLDRPRIIAKHVALAHPESSVLNHDDTARGERLGGGLDGRRAAGHTKIGLECTQRVEQRVHAPDEFGAR